MSDGELPKEFSGAATPPNPPVHTEVPDAAARRLAKSSLVMATGTLTSRVLGLVRAILLTGIVGATGLSADAFDVANTLPNQFYLILAGGVLNAVLVPQIVRASKLPDGGVEFVNRLVTLAVTFFLGATVLVTLLGPVLVRLYFETSDPAALDLAVAFAWICLPQVFFYALYTVLGQILNAHGRFGAYMWAPVIANVVALAGLVAFRVSGQPLMAAPGRWNTAMIAILAGSATVSIVMQALFLLIPLRRMGFHYRPTWGLRGVGLRSASRVAVWTFAGVVVNQLGFIVTSRVLTGATDAAKAAGLTAAGKAAYSNAFLLFIVAHSVVTVSLATALFTKMAHAASEQDHAELVSDVGRGLRMPAVILVPAVAFGLCFGPLVTRSFFFIIPVAQTDAIAMVMVPLFLGILPFAWLYVVNRFFYANEDAKVPFVTQCIVTAISVAVTLLATLAPTRYIASVVGLGQSAAYIVGATVGFVVVRRRIGRLGLRATATAYARLGVPALALAALMSVSVHVLLPDLAAHRLRGVVVVTLAGIVQIVGTLLAAHLLGVHEVRALVRPLVRRVRRV